jgi:farnesyl diphosphate synthase
MSLSVNLASRLSEVSVKVKATLSALIPETMGPEQSLVNAMRYAVLGDGKFLRPLLVLESGGLFDVDGSRLLRVAAAIEVVHCYSLVHDDLPCMDDDDLRRGQPTVHKKFDEATAVLAGDALLSLAFEILSDAQTHFDPNVRIQLVSLLARIAGAKGMVGGQMMDMSGFQLGNDIAAISRMQRLKTGGLFGFAVESGAILGKASEKLHHNLNSFAHDFGLAFQIADDILDVVGNVETLGKAVGKDQSHGKATFVSVMGLEGAKAHLSYLCSQAKEHLHVFGARADILKALVDSVESRTI